MMAASLVYDRSTDPGFAGMYTDCMKGDDGGSAEAFGAMISLWWLRPWRLTCTG